MSSQHDDDGTVIRPDPLAAAAMPAVTLPGQIDEDSPPETEDGMSLRIGTRLAGGAVRGIGLERAPREP